MPAAKLVRKLARRPPAGSPLGGRAADGDAGARLGKPGRAARQPGVQAARPRRADARADPGDARRRRRARPGHPNGRERAGVRAGSARPRADRQHAGGDRALLLGRGQIGSPPAHPAPVESLVAGAPDAATHGDRRPPDPAYDELTARQVTERLRGLAPAELRRVREYERRHANRKSVLTAIDARAEPARVRRARGLSSRTPRTRPLCR